VKFFDVNGIEIKKGDVVELVLGNDSMRAPGELSVGERLTVGAVSISRVCGAAHFCESDDRMSRGWGSWRVVDAKRDTFPAEAPTSVECPHPSAPPLPAAQTGYWPRSDALAYALAHPPGPRHAKSPDILETPLGQGIPFAGNPKDAIGSAKAPRMPVPTTIQALDGLAMLEGALKYGRHNYRAAPVRASVYIDAADRHMKSWIEGEDIDPDSGLPHLAKARACFGIIIDAQICGTLIDDRPPAKVPAGFFDECNKLAAALVGKHLNPVAPYVQGDARMRDPRLTPAQVRDVIETELDALKARTLPR
jgi:dATP/dGTP diphosphohydrolase